MLSHGGAVKQLGVRTREAYGYGTSAPPDPDPVTPSRRHVGNAAPWNARITGAHALPELRKKSGRVNTDADIDFTKGSPCLPRGDKAHTQVDAGVSVESRAAAASADCCAHSHDRRTSTQYGEEARGGLATRGSIQTQMGALFVGQVQVYVVKALLCGGRLRVCGKGLLSREGKLSGVVGHSTVTPQHAFKAQPAGHSLGVFWKEGGSGGRGSRGRGSEGSRGKKGLRAVASASLEVGPDNFSPVVRVGSGFGEGEI
ncbi:hypothetical protein EYF80_042555 [Liparis tanakae]|uniref:Uncharacterized protein n=1 Tax=Liparis tanakae TaxID=230148 RepID=A0A4Z2G169_9TELE|nr:hypothetical protein EYF80_042555 [Liparis tanakae]